MNRYKLLSAQVALDNPTDADLNITRFRGVSELVPPQTMLPLPEIARNYVAPTARLTNFDLFLDPTGSGRRSSTVTLPFAGRTRHFAAIGATGSGKSEMFMQLIASDIADPDRRYGVSLVDTADVIMVNLDLKKRKHESLNRKQVNSK